MEALFGPKAVLISSLMLLMMIFLLRLVVVMKVILVVTVLIVNVEFRTVRLIPSSPWGSVGVSQSFKAIGNE